MSNSSFSAMRKVFSLPLRTAQVMSIVHPVQNVVSCHNGTQVFTVIKNVVVAFKKTEDNEFKLVGKWVDTYNEQQKQKETANKKVKTNQGEAVDPTKSTREVTDAEAISLNANIRSLQIFNNDTQLAACTDSDKGIVILQIDNTNETNCLSLMKRESFPKRPNAISVSGDNTKIFMADKFGDVYVMSADVNVPVAKDQTPLLGHVSMLTDLLYKKDQETGQEYVLTADRDEHIKISQYPNSFIIKNWLFGHHEFISSLSKINWNNNWILSAGGDDVIFNWDWNNEKLLDSFNFKDLIQDYLTDDHLAPSRFQNDENNVIEYCVSKIVSLKTLPYCAFFVEATKVLIILKINQDNGSLSFHGKIELPKNIIALNMDNDQFIVSLDNRNDANKNFIKLIKIAHDNENFAIDENDSLQLNDTIESTLNDDKDVVVALKNVYSLYNTINLKKHGEHFS